MSCLKMYCLEPKVKGLTLPEGFTLTRYQSEADIEPWLDICRNGLIGENATSETFYRELVYIDGADPRRDTYFVEHEGEKVATITIVPNMWSSGMGYIHMVACKPKCRGRGIAKFMSDFAIKKLTEEMGKERLFLLSSESRLPALSVYFKAGFLPVNELGDEETIQRWQYVVDSLKIPSVTLLNNDGTPDRILYCQTA